MIKFIIFPSIPFFTLRNFLKSKFGIGGRSTVYSRDPEGDGLVHPAPPSRFFTEVVPTLAPKILPGTSFSHEFFQWKVSSQKF